MGQSEGPAGVTVSLHKRGSEAPLMQAQTSAGGGYVI